MRVSSLSAKIFVAFLVILATFGGVTAYGAFTMHRLGDEVQRVTDGYLALRLDLHDLQTRQLNLVQLVERADEETQRAGFVKGDIDAGRRYRKAQAHKVELLADALVAEARNGQEAGFLRSVAERLRTIERTFEEDEELFDRVFGPPGSKPIVSPERHVEEAAHDRLLKRESSLLKKDLGDLMLDLRGQVRRAERQLEVDERVAVWATVLLALLAALVGLGVVLLMQRALAPLGRLAQSAKEVARGDYRQRVQVQSDDEIGQLASEFNAMAGALEERELRLIRSERLAAVGKIAAQITHEVRNPLSSIGLNAELLEEDLAAREDSGDGRALAAAIVKEVDRLGAITEQYLSFARLPRPMLEREDLNAIVSSLLAFLREELAGRHIEVSARLARDLPSVPADENQLRQALLNLLRNAAEAMAEGGCLTLETLAEPGFVKLRIGDTGVGIPSDDRAKIFDPFYTTKKGGTGLGLPITQQIIVEHGGGIEVESEPGRGTTFIVRLPALVGDGLLPAPAAAR